MAAYFIAHITIRDPEGYQRYLDGFDQIFDDYRGKVLAVDDHPELLEGESNRPRCVVIEFPTMAELKRWYTSPRYQVLAQLRHQASEADIIAVAGY